VQLAERRHDEYGAHLFSQCIQIIVPGSLYVIPILVAIAIWLYPLGVLGQRRVLHAYSVNFP
jgi:hypothetical protein